MERMERMQSTAQDGAAVAILGLRRPAGAQGRGVGWPPDEMSPAAVEVLKDELTDLRARLAQAAPRRAVVEMDRAISLLHRRVEDLRLAQREDGTALPPDPAAHEAMARLAEELSVLRTDLDAVRAPERFEALDAGVELLGRKIDIMNAKAVDPVEMARLQAQSAELKELVGRALSGHALQPLAERLASCAAQITAAGAETARRVVDATSAFERNAEALLSRVESFEQEAREGRDATAHELRRDVEANVQSIHRRLDTVSAQIAALSPAMDGAFTERLAALLERMESVDEADKAVIAPLTGVVERHLLALTERFHDAHARLERLDGIEEAVNRVLGELRQVRESSVDAAAEVAEAMALKVSDAPDGPAVVGLKRGLAALEARQDEVERRTSALLGDPAQDLAVALDRTEDDVWTPRAPEPEPAPAAMPETDFERAFAQEFDPPLPPEPAFEPAFEPSFEPAFEASCATAPEAAAAPFEAPEIEAPQAEAFPTDISPADGAGPAAPRDDAAAPADDAAPFFATADDPFWGQIDRRIDPHLAAEPRAGEPAPGSAEAAPPRRQRKVDWGPAGQKIRNDARPRVERHHRGKPRRLRARRVSWAGVAASVLAVALVTSAGFAWGHRAVIYDRAASAIEQLRTKVEAQAGNRAEAQAGARSVAQLPPPIGPSALRTAALEGDLAAAYEVGVRYADGVGADTNLDAAIQWLGFAVSHGYAQAAYRLGSVYENGVRNLDEAYRFYKWAAEQGNVRAMHNLAVLYSQGVAGGKPDWSQAIHWFRKAAELGLKDAQHNLGIIFARGLSGRSDLREALTWFTIAANQGDQDSADKRDTLARQADADTLEAAKKAASAFKVHPLNEDANVVLAKPEWNATEAGEKVAVDPSLFSSRLMASRK